MQPTAEQVILSLAEPAVFQRVLNMIERAVEGSFVLCPCRRTRAEERRRAVRAFEIWKDLRAECRYPLARIEDTLVMYLSYDLDGIEWNPLKRKSWLPGDPVARTLPSFDHEARMLVGQG